MFQWNQTYIVNDASKVTTTKFREANDTLRVVGATDLLKSGIVEVRKTAHIAAVPGSVKITLPATGEATELRRIKLYVRLSGSNNPYYANDLVFKGKPFIYEYKADKNAEAVAKTIKSINAAYGDVYLKVTSDSTSITFTGDNYTKFTEAVVEKFEPISGDINGGKWTPLTATVAFTEPVNGFGTYEHIIKDLRLPTSENTAYLNANAAEMPIPGAQYTQYTVTYKNTVGVQGGGHIGDIVTAQTTHAFYVISTATSAFESAVGTDKIKTLNAVPSAEKDNEWNEAGE